MSKAYKCDRCGILYEYDYQLYLHSYFVSKDCHPQGDLKLDLCPMCQKSLESWFANPMPAIKLDYIECTEEQK